MLCWLKILWKCIMKMELGTQRNNCSIDQEDFVVSYKVGEARLTEDEEALTGTVKMTIYLKYFKEINIGIKMFPWFQKSELFPLPFFFVLESELSRAVNKWFSGRFPLINIFRSYLVMLIFIFLKAFGLVTFIVSLTLFLICEALALGIW